MLSIYSTDLYQALSIPFFGNQAIGRIVGAGGIEQGECAGDSPVSSHKMYQVDGFRKSTPPQNYHFIVCCYELKQEVDDFVRKVTF